MYTMAQKRTMEGYQYVPKVLSPGKVCRECGSELTVDNIPQSRIDKYDYLCDACGLAKLALLRGQYRYGTKGDKYDIVRGQDTSAPRLNKVDYDSFDSNYDLLKDTIQATEKYRIDRMISIALRKKSEGKDRKAAISYLLKSFDKLKKRQCVALINVIHKIMGDKNIADDIKVKLSLELKIFTGDSKSVKDQPGSSYESMLLGKENIDIDE